jgi:hypothetical protein
VGFAQLTKWESLTPNGCAFFRTYNELILTALIWGRLHGNMRGGPALSALDLIRAACYYFRGCDEEKEAKLAYER